MGNQKSKSKSRNKSSCISRGQQQKSRTPLKVADTIKNLTATKVQTPKNIKNTPDRDRQYSPWKIK